MINLEEEIEPAFQPVYDFRQGKVAFYEALLRIRNDERDAKHIEYITLGERFGCPMGIMIRLRGNPEVAPLFAA
ncbi:MAG: EAL domain-containing protein [Pseudomonadota bacterium]|nr:EAL domain-containing protein [Pseudomonadota bacterium]